MPLLYWTTTTTVCLLTVVSALSYFLHQATIEGIRALGLPDYLRLELAILKLLAAAVLFLPLPILVKHWAYAGIALFILTAIVGHIAHRDRPVIFAVLGFSFLLLCTSYVALLKMPNSG